MKEKQLEPGFDPSILSIRGIQDNISSTETRSVKSYASQEKQLLNLHPVRTERSNKVPKNLQVITLKAQLYGRAKDLCRAIESDVLISEHGAQAIVDSVYKRDTLAVVNDVYIDYMKLQSLRRGENESFVNYESRFQAQLAKYNSHC